MMKVSKKNRLANFFNLKSENLYTAANFLESLFNVWCFLFQFQN